jgi:hypothetical protein
VRHAAGGPEPVSQGIVAQHGIGQIDAAQALHALERDPAEAVSLDVPADHERPPRLMGLVGPGAPNPYVAPIQP